MNYNQQFQGHKCSGCFKTIPAGFEKPCWTTGGNRIILNQLFFSLCMQTRGGRDFSKPYSDLNHLDLEIIDTLEFKKYMEYFYNSLQKRWTSFKITIEGEKLVIEYSNETKKTVAVDTNQLKIIQERMKKVKKKFLSATELGLDYKANDNPSNQTKETNYTPWIIGGCIIGGVLVIEIVVYLLRKNHKK